MQHKKRARILLQFFWEQRMVGLFLVLAISIFALVFSMYDIKLEAILYASMLCLTAGLLFEGVHLISYLRRHTEQQKRLQGLPFFYSELPPPRTLAEQDLQAMVQKLGSNTPPLLLTGSDSKKRVWTITVHGCIKSKRRFPA